MIVTFPYYDPAGKYESAFRRQMATLKSTFDAVCVSAVPPISRQNEEFLRWMEGEGCLVHRNAAGTPIGDHAREGLRLAIREAKRKEPILWMPENRLLLALETEWRADFLHGVQTEAHPEFLILERSETAWATHPDNYREIEQTISHVFEILCGRSIELMPCALVLDPSVAHDVLSESISPGHEVWAEWTLLALKKGIPVTTRKVDWLVYQHPYWEQIDPVVMKREREGSREETIKRIAMNAPVALLMIEERFKRVLHT